jgi:FkbM family methyltransferase
MNQVVNKILDLTKSYDEADFLTNIFGRLRQEAVRGKVPVVLFGAGSAGKELFPLFNKHGIDPLCFCDSNPERQEELCCGLKVLSPEELSRAHKDSLIVVTATRHCNEIKMQLIQDGFPPDNILCSDEEAVKRYYSRVCLSHWTHEDLCAQEDSLSAAYNLMCDDTSKRFFIQYLSILTNGSDYSSFCDFIRQFSEPDLYTLNVTEVYLYFNTDIVNFTNDEVLVDCGAYNGDSAIAFINSCRKHHADYKHIYCFEPEPSLYSQLVDNMAKYPNVTTFNSGLWTHSTTLSFANTEIERPGATRVIRDSGDIHFSDEKVANSHIRVTSIDEQVQDDEVTFIKMDVEGSETEALQGAKSVIKRCTPKLAISIYHKRNDIFEIPLLIHSIYPGYRFYLKQFSNALSETVLFAIP